MLLDVTLEIINVYRFLFLSKNLVVHDIFKEVSVAL